MGILEAGPRSSCLIWELPLVAGPTMNLLHRPRYPNHPAPSEHGCHGFRRFATGIELELLEGVKKAWDGWDSGSGFGYSSWTFFVF